MGLAISFNKQQAVDAGMQLTKETPVFTDEELAELHKEDADYIAYRLAGTLIGTIPVDDTSKSFAVDGYAGDVLLVRANNWGTTYTPLTAWLTEHGIAWYEF